MEMGWRKCVASQEDGIIRSLTVFVCEGGWVGGSGGEGGGGDTRLLVHFKTVFENRRPDRRDGDSVAFSNFTHAGFISTLRSSFKFIFQAVDTPTSTTHIP